MSKYSVYFSKKASKSDILYLLYLLAIISLSLGQFARFFKSPEINIYLFDLAVGVFALFGFLYFLGVEKSLKIPKFLIGFVFFTFWALISLIPQGFLLSSQRFLSGGVYLARWVVYLLSAVVVYNMVWQKKITFGKVIKPFILSALFISLAGFIQLVLFPDFGALNSSLGWDPHKNRLLSTFFDPNFTGGYLTIVLGVILGLLLSNLKKFPLGKRNLISISLVIFTALFLTFSRSSWGMLAVIILIFGLFQSRRLLLIAGIFAFLTYFAVPRVQTRLAGVTDPADSAGFRLVSWKNTWEIARDNLLLGVGFNNFRYAQKDYGFFEPGSLGGHGGAGSDSSFLLVLATTGIFGLLIFSLSYFYPLGLLLKVRENPLNVVLPAVIAGLFVQTQFINVFFYPQIMFLILILFGIFSLGRGLAED